MSKRRDIRDWMFRRLMFEADAERFRSAGIRVGASELESERSLLEETLDPFSVDLRDEALRMTRLYALTYCFENSVRALIRERLQERYGASWWDDKVPKRARELAESRQDTAQKESWLEGLKREALGFMEFGNLADVTIENWEDFADLVPSQHWLKQRFDELEQARNFVAHNRLLQPGEFRRIEMYIADWNRQVGL